MKALPINKIFHTPKQTTTIYNLRLDENRILNWLPRKSKKQFLFDELKEDKDKFTNKSISLVNKVNALTFGTFLSMCAASVESKDIAQVTLLTAPFLYVTCTRLVYLTKKIAQKLNK